MKKNLLICILFSAISTTAFGQARTVNVGGVTIDDGNSHTITLKAPTGMSSNFTWTLPLPPALPTQSGFVPVGTSAGQMLSWTGSQWSPSSALTIGGSALGMGLSLLPATDNVLNIGDATHRIDTLFVSTLVGPALGGGSSTNYWQRNTTTVSPATSGDNISTSGKLQLVGSNGTTSFSAGAQSGANLNYTLPTSSGSALTSLTNDGSGNLSWSSPIKFARKSSFQNYFGTSLTNDANLTFAVGANEVYTFEAFLSFSDPTSSGTSAKLAITTPSGATLKWGYIDAIGIANSQTPTAFPSSSVNPVSIQIYNDTFGTAETLILVKGSIVNGSTAGSLQIQAASTTAAVLRLNAGSYIQATRVQ